tara:strand:- start:198 stop:776 length:579 start_codon:yes stop_codon:yes gene_type:complete
VSHSNKFIYVKSYKTASTSVEIFFERFCKNLDIVGYRGPNPVPKDCTWYNHMTPSKIKEKLGDDSAWNSYLKFGCVRNPWDRIVSSYFFETTILLPYNVKPTFEEYCMTRKFSGLSRFFNLDMDYYIRFEKLHEDIQNVCSLLKLPCDMSLLTHKKKTNHKHYTEYYTDEMRDKIARDCRDDIDFFNYTFGE